MATREERRIAQLTEQVRHYQARDRNMRQYTRMLERALNHQGGNVASVYLAYAAWCAEQRETSKAEG